MPSSILLLNDFQGEGRKQRSGGRINLFWMFQGSDWVYELAVLDFPSPAEIEAQTEVIWRNM